MKKTLLTLGLFSLLTLGFVSCGDDDDTNNCACTVTTTSTTTGSTSNSDKMLVMNFNGDCSAITWVNLPNSANWDPSQLSGTGMTETVNCAATEDTVASNYPGGVAR